MKVIGLAGWSGAGKTTLLTRLIPHFNALGLRVSVIKHAHHQFDVDVPGKDSWRHREAGAAEVLVASSNRWALMHELDGSPADEPSLQEILGKLGPCDLVLVEGYKREGHPKIEVRDVGQDAPLLAASDATVIAVAANGPVAGVSVPVFDRDDHHGLADFVAAWAELRR